YLLGFAPVHQTSHASLHAPLLKAHRLRELLKRLLAITCPRAQMSPRGALSICSKDRSISGGGCYSITSSARASSEGGMVRPMALAVLRLMTSSNFVGCSTGSSAAFTPRSRRSTSKPAHRYIVAMSGPYDSSNPSRENSLVSL